jgi:hypothetical protein
MLNDEDGVFMMDGLGVQNFQCFLSESFPVRGIHENEIKNLSFSAKLANDPRNLASDNVRPVIKAAVRKILFNQVDR